jgi:hypothetical protein
LIAGRSIRAQQFAKFGGMPIILVGFFAKDKLNMKTMQIRDAGPALKIESQMQRQAPRACRMTCTARSG